MERLFFISSTEWAGLEEEAAYFSWLSSHPLVDSHVNDWFLGGIRGRREEQLKG